MSSDLAPLNTPPTNSRKHQPVAFFRDLNISAIYRSSLSISKTCFALANQRVASTRYEKVGPRLGFVIVPKKADKGFGLPPSIGVEVFVVMDVRW